MNKKSWHKLPSEIQTIFNEISSEWNEKHALMWNNVDLTGYKFSKEKGVTFIDLPKAEVETWKQNILPVKAKYTEDMKKRGFSDEQVLSWFNLIDERIEYWQSKQKESGIESIVPLE